MNIENFRDYCLSLPGTSESLPFGPDTLVFKVGTKMFALTDIENFESINLKCDPDKAIDLRARHPEVKPGYHMNKRHWNTIEITHRISDDEYRTWIRASYDLVFAKLTKKEQESIVIG
ncbi:MmcQ/YjbR family DNA-binding protein [Membranicola marinus]|uniref:MmcQ/YjbR family DNA-binding protein n=1 Tax=Membranihabitans marinus TaxID=1227546 RepID=A0A953HLZ7_9BACT|nr:MmcQ/YjbR family DNA-binding protein [Membranihabitans marinus]MBY5958419.1 MmcQ/YjbR family DNA-binding protein [Membranihabitans marinus]